MERHDDESDSSTRSSRRWRPSIGARSCGSSASRRPRPGKTCCAADEVCACKLSDHLGLVGVHDLASHVGAARGRTRRRAQGGLVDVLHASPRGARRGRGGTQAPLDTAARAGQVAELAFLALGVRKSSMSSHVTRRNHDHQGAGSGMHELPEARGRSPARPSPSSASTPRSSRSPTSPRSWRYGVMSTPALVVDEELKVAGRVPSYDDVVSILQRSAELARHSDRRRAMDPFYPLQLLSDWLTYTVLGLAPDEQARHVGGLLPVRRAEGAHPAGRGHLLRGDHPVVLPAREDPQAAVALQALRRQRRRGASRHRDAVLLVLGGAAVHRLRRERRAARRDVLVPGGEPDDQRGRDHPAVAACSAGRSPRSTSCSGLVIAIVERHHHRQARARELGRGVRLPDPHGRGRRAARADVARAARVRARLRGRDRRQGVAVRGRRHRDRRRHARLHPRRLPREVRRAGQSVRRAARGPRRRAALQQRRRRHPARERAHREGRGDGHRRSPS